jgi:predicted polyphosphate/ATP-dependent NAD kinase
MPSESNADTAPRLGLLVNPIAGMGGRVGLKGTDGAEVLALARERGATPVAPARAGRALRALAGEGVRPHVVAAPGAMGADLAREAGLDVETTAEAGGEPTGPEDTRAAAAEILRRGVDLLVFAGGDGTARDIHDAVDGRLPMVGVPTGVKMHSGVFAATPHAAGAVAAAFLRDPARVRLRNAEIADVDEEAVRAGRVATRLYGSARVPEAPRLMVAAKAASQPSGAAVDGACREIAEGMQPGRLYLLGPGTTTAAVSAHLGLGATLLGVDAVIDGRSAGTDLDEAGVLALLDRHDGARLVLGVVGGQGSLLGRGNQQLSPRVLRRIGRDGLVVVAAAPKLLALNPPTLRLDTGDDALDAELSGHVRVHVAPRRTIVMNVSN